MKTLISAENLKQNISRNSWLIIDTRFSLADVNAGKAAYLKGHIPGAIFLDMEKNLSAVHKPGITGRHPLPEKETWFKELVSIGLRPDTQVVIYDDMGGAGAARLWWMLRWAGHEKVAVLDGGWQAWLKLGGESSIQPAQEPLSGADYSQFQSLTLLMTANQIDSSSQSLLDARNQDRFEGENEVIDPVAGHIPGAVCLPFSGNLDSSLRFLDVDSLRKRFDPYVNNRDVVCYCGSGVTACHNILAMIHAGYSEPALYSGSWSEWITDPERGIEPGNRNQT